MATKKELENRIDTLEEAVESLMRGHMVLADALDELIGETDEEPAVIFLDGLPDHIKEVIKEYASS